MDAKKGGTCCSRPRLGVLGKKSTAGVWGLFSGNAQGFFTQIEVEANVQKNAHTIMVLMAIGKIFFSDFGLFYQVPMNSGALYGVTQTIDTFVYRGLMELNDVGMSSAAGLFQSCVGFVLVITANALVRKMNPENALF